jgi:2-keto-3-deoxy-L-rhamnonate aldolase RhmA
MNKKQLSGALASGRRVYGTCVTSPNPIWVTGLKKIGIDFIFADTEHIPLDVTQVHSSARQHEALGIAPIVRIQSPNPFDACAWLRCSFRHWLRRLRRLISDRYSPQ